MKDNLPQVYKEGFFTRMKKFFTRLFVKREEKPIIEENVEVCKEIKVSNDFKKGLAVSEIASSNYQKETKKSIINTVEEKPELLQTMSTENLKRLVILYEELIKENDKKIKILKNTI